MAVPKEAPVWFQHTFDLPEGPIWNVNATSQTPRAKVTAKIALYSYQQDVEEPEENFVLVDLSGDGNSSSVNPGKIYYQQPDKCGGFTDRVGTSIWFSDEPRFTVRASGPDTTAAKGSVSTSVSCSLSGGLFGGTATGNASWSISSGFGKSIDDFIIENSTTGTGSTIAQTMYWLNMVDGGEYIAPPDIVDTAGDGSMRRLPSRATADLPIYSSALFHSGEKIDATRTLHIRLEHRVMSVEKTYRGPTWSPNVALHRDGWDQAREHLKPCHLGFMQIDTRPLVVGREWRFNVDLKNGGVKYIG